jgi:hypothetical protein
LGCIFWVPQVSLFSLASLAGQYGPVKKKNQNTAADGTFSVDREET